MFYGFGVDVGVNTAVAVIETVGVSDSVVVNVEVAVTTGDPEGAGVCGTAPAGAGVASVRNVSSLAVVNGSALAPGSFTYQVESDEIAG